MIELIINNDNTSIDDIPKNPLRDKWESMISRNGKPCSLVLGYNEDGSPIMNYSCIMCDEKSCYHSDSFVVPDEDRSTYNKFLNELDDYFRTHKNILKS